REIGETAGNSAESLRLLVGVNEMRMGVMHEFRRTNIGFPAADAGASNGKRKKQVGITNGVVIKKVARTGTEVVERWSPSTIGDDNAHVVLFVTLAVQRQETEVLRPCEGKCRSGHGIEWRRLIVARI